MKTKLYSLALIFLFVMLIMLSPNVGFAQMTRTAQSDNSEFLEGTIVIKVKEGIGPFEMQKTNISFGISSLDKKVQEYAISKLEKRFNHKPIAKNSGLPDLSRIYRIEFPKSQNIHQMVQAFAADPNIEYAEAIPINRMAEVPSDPMYGSQQHLPQIMAPEAWDVHKGEDGEEVIVAIVDSGTDWLHPDLTENTWQNLGEDADGDGVTLEFNNGVWERDPDDLNGIDDDGNGYVDDVIGWDFWEAAEIGDGSNPDPLWGQGLNEHGTHCAGIAAGRTNNGIGISSVSYNVKYMPVQTDDGNNTVLYGWDGIIYAAENGADIISNSWGNSVYSELGRETIEYAVGLGSIVVVAAHNFNTDNKFYPAAFPGSISVSALNPDDTKASFTNYGAWLDIAAPGVSILSTVTDDGYASWGGTSMATPMVAGLFGLLKSYNPDWTNDQLIEQLIGTADDIDDLNPGYENALGSGRINAYHTLIGVDVEVPQELRLELLNYSILDENEDGNIEPGELCTVSVTMRNYAHLVSNENTTFLLSSLDPAIEFISGSYTGEVPSDSNFEFENIFEFRVAEDANPHIADFILEVSSDLPVTYGNETEFALLVAPTGFLVWEGEPGVQDFSGEFIRDFLEERGHDVFYSTTFPESFAGFDAVFLSFGGSGEISGEYTVVEETHSVTIQQYLEEGGIVYTEGSPFFFMSEYWDYPNHDELVNLYGVTTGYGILGQNPINKLDGLAETINEGMVFNASNQNLNWYIDRIIPNETGKASFTEEDYGDVSIYNEGEFGQKTYYFSYVLAELVDVDPHSSRYNFLVQLMDFFGYPEEDGLVANFSVDKTEGKPDFEVQFTDWSITENETEITSWAWDFNEDGEFDSYDQNPNWTFTTGGVYDISLVVFGSGGEIDTLVKKDFITVRSGILVYEGSQNANGYSGSFISEYLQNHWYDEVGYTNTFPNSLSGYDAVFVSFGNTGLRGTELTSSMSSALFDYALTGGKVYIEGGDVMHSFDISELWVFGLSATEDGEKNELSELNGEEGSLTKDLVFNSSNQLSVRSIDNYSIMQEPPGAQIAFTEGDYGTVAVEFDGSVGPGQKTFCMSYALADLENVGRSNTREDLLERILNFFDVIADVDEVSVTTGDQIIMYPNPVSNELTISGLPVNTDIYLSDLSGNLLMTLKSGLSNTKLSISELPKGLYLLRTALGTKKIVKM